jgi:S1-C subfamily serine protease
MSVADTVSRVAPALVVIRAFDDDGRLLSAGSGFIARDGRIVTNAHVLTGAARADVVGHDEHVLAVARFAEALSVALDIAVLPGPAQSSDGGLEIAVGPVRVGERVVAFGAPEGLTNSVSDGILSAIRQVGERTLLQITAPISPGSSGGPITDVEGRVLGMATAYLAAGQNLNFAVRAEDIQAVLECPPGRYAFPASGDRPVSGTRESPAPVPTDLKVLDAEFVSESVDLAKVEAGAYRGTFRAGEPWISFYARIAGLAAGDAVALSLTGADGRVLTSGEFTIQPATARYTVIRFGQRRTDHDVWQPGRYLANVRVTRNGAEILKISKTIEVP